VQGLCRARLALRRVDSIVQGGRAFEPAEPDVPGLELVDSMAVDGGNNVCVDTLCTGLTVVAPNGAVRRHVCLPDQFTRDVWLVGGGVKKAWRASLAKQPFAKST